MTDTAISTAAAPDAVPAHPLSPVTAEEFRAGRRVLAEAGLLAAAARYAYSRRDAPPQGQRRAPALDFRPRTC
jgi:hypothetical protein